MRYIVKKTELVAVSLSIVVLCFGVPACTTPSATATATQFATVQKGDIKINITSVGNLVSAQDAKLTFGSAAKVNEVLVGLGDRVKEGQVLARLDTLTLQRSLTQAQLGVKQAQQTLENAKEPKTSGSSTSAPDPLTIEMAEFSLEGKKLDLEDAQKNLQQATMIAPFEGIIAEVNLVQGDQISATATAIRLISPTKFRVTFQVNETDISKVKVGMLASVQLESQKDLIFPAAIAHISPVATIQSNVVSYKVEVQFDAAEIIAAAQQAAATTRPSQPGTTVFPGIPQRSTTSNTTQNTTALNMTQNATQNTTAPGSTQQGQQQRTTGRQPTTGSSPAITGAAIISGDFQLREGQTVIASITVSQVTDIVLVSNRVITTKAGKNYATVILDSGKTEERAIQIGITDGSNTQVISGLNENEKVLIVTAGSPTTSTNTTSPQQQRPPSGGVVPNLNQLVR